MVFKSSIYIPGGGGGSVNSVTGLNTDNSNPTNPIVKISVDGVTITGLGTPASPLVSAGGSGMAIGGTVTSGTPGSLLFVGAGPVLAQDNANLFWDATNARLGVGTNAPIALFEVSGASTGQAYIHNSAASVATLYVKNFSTGAALFVEGTGSNYIQGNLGQNITTPGSTAANGFTLNSNSRTFEQRSATTAGYSSLYLRRSDGAVGLDITSDNSSTGTIFMDSRFNNTGPMFIFRGRTNGTAVNLVSMLGSGRVGVGTSTPNARLHIDNSTGATEAGNLMQITNSTGATAFTLDNGTMHANFYNGGGINVPSLGYNSAVGISVSGGLATSDLGLCVNSTAMVIINSSGNVAIGTPSTAAARLYVLSTTNQIRTGYDTSNYFDTTVSSAGAVTFDAVGASAGFAFSDSVALGTNSLTLTGSIASTGSRVTKGWFTDLEVTNAPTLGGVAIPSISSTNTLTNKRITKRVVTEADATSVTPNIDTSDITYQANTQALGTLIMNAPTGTPTNGQPWLFKIKSTNVQTFSWNAAYAGGTVALPTVSTGAAKIDYFSFIYDTVNSKYQFTGTAVGF